MRTLTASLSLVALGLAAPALAQEAPAPAPAPGDPVEPAPIDPSPIDPIDVEPGDEPFLAELRRLRLRPKAQGFTERVVIVDGGDGSAGRIASVDVDVQVADLYPPVRLPPGDPDFDTLMRSGSVDFGWVTAPAGTYVVTAQLLDNGGNIVGPYQEFEVSVDGLEAYAVPITGGGEDGPSVDDLRFSVNDCGNGRLRATVSGDGSADIAGINFVWEAQGGTAPVEPESLGTPTRGRSVVVQTGLQLGTIADGLLGSPETPVVVTVTAKGADGGVLGTVTTEATAKYGDILIDGVPLIFD
jgi:hypothetical protein